MKRPKSMWPYALFIGMLLEAFKFAVLFFFDRGNAQTIPLLLITPLSGAALIRLWESNLKRDEKIRAEAAQMEAGQKNKLLAEAELKALQSQINPHFLFNALNTISYYCRSQPDTAKRLLIHLADYYRHSLSDANILIPLKREMQHVNAYLNIEMAGFGERLKVKYNIAIEEDFLLPALIIQPLVENAVKHGIHPKLRGGCVCVNIERSKDAFIISVTDDGVGVDDDNPERLLSADAPRCSIGLPNVHKRLINMYGPDCGLSIRSKKGQGTVVSFKIPVAQGDLLCR